MFTSRTSRAATAPMSTATRSASAIASGAGPDHALPHGVVFQATASRSPRLLTTPVGRTSALVVTTSHRQLDRHVSGWTSPPARPACGRKSIPRPSSRPSWKSAEPGPGLGLNDVLPKVLDSLFDDLRPGGPGVHRAPRAGHGRLVPKALKHRRPGTGRDGPHQPHHRQRRDGHQGGHPLGRCASDVRFNAAESIVDFHIRSMMCAPLVNSRGRSAGRDPDRHARPAEPFQPRRSGGAGERGLPGGHRRGKRAVARSGPARPAAEPRTGTGPRRAAGLPAASPRRGSRATSSSTSTSRPTNWAAIITTTSRCPAAAWPWSWPTSRGKGIPASLLMAKLSADVRYCLASEPTPADAVAQLEPRLLRQRLGRPLRDPVAGGARSAAARGDDRQRRASAAYLCRGGTVLPAIDEADARLPLGVGDDATYVQIDSAGRRATAWPCTPTASPRP